MAKMLPAIFNGDNDTESKIYNLFKDGVWYQSYNTVPLKHGGPFKQAQDGMHILKRKSNAKFSK